MTAPSDIARFDEAVSRVSPTGDDETVFDETQRADEKVGALRGLRFETVTSRERLRTLAGDWNELLTRTRAGHHVFQTFGWCQTWWDICLRHAPSGKGYELRILTGWHGSRLVMLWPLMLCNRDRLRVATWLGAPLTQYGDILIEPGPQSGDWIEQGWTVVKNWRDCDLVSLRKVRCDSPLYPVLENHGLEVGAREHAPFIDLAAFPDWATYRATLRAKSRKQQDRFSRNLEKAGRVTFDVDASPETAAGLAREAVAMKRTWLEKTGRVSDAISDRMTEELLAALVSWPNADLRCHAAALRLDGHAIAIEIGLGGDGHFCSFIGAYDPDFAHLRAGNVELESMIRWSLQNGYASYDLLAPSDTYKQRWSTGSVEIADFASATSLKGMVMIGFYLKWLRPRLKSLYYTLPASVRAKGLDLLRR